MSDFNHLSDQLASQQIAERVATAQRSRIARQEQPRGRHALARHLHRMADRLDG